MNLAELIAKMGDDVRFQNLDQCADSLDYNHKKGTKITFGTDMSIHHERGTERLGLVVWLDRKKVQEAIDEAKSKA
jgi:hypothetical protein